ncbi:MAG: DNA-binding protein [Candidatus Kerfeldbacteria bacterium RIFCSPHIGHO2_12_FULL_48_17]|uniref:DNA-binding protein n=1 Tax=Candidatus Kerfeldbacteria bacterium RIFCSPHIGHO2_12_FULL_48_17 TaxID=1798542 RepID=A0A1G2B3R1_9BACT|nr:MAG: DNA-binding protein [Candidatus Kerfeldbacteria bacterium RIFCSPHIGHO2_12_FULL_48_17]
MHAKNQSVTALTSERIISRIYMIRGKKVMLDSDLAIFYAVKTKVLNQAIKRNIDRFPEDFMFQLSEKEQESLRSQIVTSNKGRGGRRYQVYAFTEQGVAMLSAVLKSQKAIHISILIMRSFIQLRELLATNTQLRRKMEEMEGKYDRKFAVVFRVIQKLLQEETKPKDEIGFQAQKK